MRPIPHPHLRQVPLFSRRDRLQPTGWTEVHGTGMRHVAVFEDGHPVDDATATTPAELAREDLSPHHVAVVAYDRPTRADVLELGELLDLHPLLVEDLLHGSQRPKLERYGDALFVVLRSAAYLDDDEDVDLDELHVVIQGRWAVVLRQGDPTDIDWDFSALEQDPTLLTLGPEAVLYTLIDQVVDGYFGVLDGVSTDIEEIEREVFSGDAAVPQRIYRLSREVVDLQHATAPLVSVVEALRAGFLKYGTTDELQTYLQDAADHLARVNSRVTEIREVLGQILTVNATLVGQRQNEDMKTISAWAAILFAPTLIGAIYGMNFDHMPELHWQYGYPLALAAMVALGAGLYVVFKRNRWL
ncbi:magnesium and cobalt transport protein CorA [Sanguibacter suaedae]|nr:magnesium and cobalt transport protein CorA [Sanguibacter suaedae]